MTNKNKEKILLNITSDQCPITFVKTKIALENLKKNQYLVVEIKNEEAIKGMPESLKELGYTITKKKSISGGIAALFILLNCFLAWDRNLEF